MPRVKPAADIAAKWARVAPTRQQDFEAGVADPQVDWARSTSAARESWEQGINESIQRGAFSRGVESAGSEKWRRKTRDVGAQRWGAGVRAAQQDMETAIQPYRDAIERTVLPPRGPRGDPRNLERSAVMARALADVRRRS